MLNNKSFLAVIPARAGSKRLPNKNRLPLAGKPLIQWTIEAAQASAFVDSIVVSSDDDTILSVAKKMGVVAQNRPGDLATDVANSADCVAYVLKQMSHQYDYLVLLQPTSPLRTSVDIDAAINKAIDCAAESVTTVTEVEHSPLWANTLPADGSFAGFIKPALSLIHI